MDLINLLQFFFQVLHLRRKYNKGNVRRVAPAKTQLLRDRGNPYHLWGKIYLQVEHKTLISTYQNL